MVKNDLVIKDKYITRFKNMIKDIKADGKTEICPEWDNTLIGGMIGQWSCAICFKHFYRSRMLHNKHERNMSLCPCSLYGPAHLIRFLNKVLTNTIKDI